MSCTSEPPVWELAGVPDGWERVGVRAGDWEGERAEGREREWGMAGWGWEKARRGGQGRRERGR